ncbi:MAG: phytanoyl-CoA dioxygenase family protein [Gammaproteobacteria bacterium]|nr:phytanoyl-CoA dioxygenase family protein [Gammaproteobacteria bacterium]
MNQAKLLTEKQISEFNRDGLLILRNFYDLEQDIKPIQKMVYEIIGFIISKYDLPIIRPEFNPESFDAGFQQILAANRTYGAEIYDAVKQIPAFIRLVAKPEHEQLFRELRTGALPGIAAGGYGVRIDNPNEDKFRASWHQEYPAQLRSLDGLVYWSPLVCVTEDMGPVEFCPGSQVEGPIPVFTQSNKKPEKTGAYSLTLKNEKDLLKKYQHIKPLTNPGDLVIIDFLVLHASGHNTSQRSRWSMQLRYFNFAEPTGQSYGWQGSYAAGINFREIHPELCAD